MTQLKTIIAAALLATAAAAPARPQPRLRTSMTAERITVREGLAGNVVSCMAQDSEGYVWIATTNALNVFDGYTVTAYEARQAGGPVVAMEEDPAAGALRLTSASGSVTLFMTATREYASPPMKPRKKAPRGREIARFGKVAYTNNGDGSLTRSAPGARPVRMRLLPPDVLAYTGHDHFHAVRMADGREAISTYGAGLYIYDPADGSTEHITAADGSGLISNDYITALMADRSGCLWLAEEQMGLTVLRPVGLPHERTLTAPGAPYPDMNYVRHISAPGKGPLTVSDNYGTAHTYDPLTGAVAPAGYRGSRIYCTLADSRGRHWTGTRGGGLCVDGRWLGTANSRLPSMDVYDIREAPDGSVYIATLGGGVARVPPGCPPAAMARVTPPGGAAGRVHAIATDAGGRVWAASEGGIWVASGGRTALYSRSRGTLPADYVVCLAADAQGYVWAGTMGGGLLRCRIEGGRMQATATRRRDGLAADNVLSVATDSLGRAWAGTESGLSCVDPLTGAVTNYLLSPASPLGDAYSERAAVALADGTLLFGTHSGLVRISPGGRTEAGQRPATRITAVEVNGGRADRTRPVAPPAGTLQTPYDMSTLRFSFSNFCYSDIHSVQYQCYLQPLEEGWGRPTGLNTATYTKLPPGRYTLHVRSSDGRGRWGGETAIDILVEEPWWNAAPARAAYALTALLAATAATAALRRIYKLRRRIEVERGVAEMKISFFANVSRQFTLPLTLIKAATDRLVAAGRTPADPASLRAIVSNAARLGSMVEKLMLFRRTAGGPMEPQAAVTDVVELLRRVCLGLRAAAEERGARIVFTPRERQRMAATDAGMVQTIAANLVDNAVAHSPQGGTVSVALRTGPERLRLTVADEGPGLSDSARRKLFTPYATGDGGGLGTGLYISSQMARALGGTLRLDPTRAGASFTLDVPLGSPGTAPASGQGAGQPAAGAARVTPGELRGMMPVPMNPGVTVVVVSDDASTAAYLSYLLGQYFATETARTAAGALEAAKATDAHLVVAELSELTDGNALAADIRKLRGRATRTIVITARGGDRWRVEAMRAGADDLLQRPFGIDVLTASCFRSVDAAREWRRAAQAAAAGAATPQPGEPLIRAERDRRFVDAFKRLVAAHAADPTATAETLAGMMKLGRAQFAKRVKELTGATPAAHLREARLLHVASQLLATGLTVDEIRQRAGFANPTHFYNLFRKRFGMSPAAYRATGGSVPKGPAERPPRAGGGARCAGDGDSGEGHAGPATGAQGNATQQG